MALGEYFFFIIYIFFLFCFLIIIYSIFCFPLSLSFRFLLLFFFFFLSLILFFTLYFFFSLFLYLFIYLPTGDCDSRCWSWQSLLQSQRHQVCRARRLRNHQTGCLPGCHPLQQRRHLEDHLIWFTFSRFLFFFSFLFFLYWFVILGLLFFLSFLFRFFFSFFKHDLIFHQTYSFLYIHWLVFSFLMLQYIFNT